MTPNRPIEIGKRFAALASGRKGLALGFWGLPGIGKSHRAAVVLGSLPFAAYKLHATTNPQAWLNLLPKTHNLPLWAERLLERIARGEYLATEALADALSVWLTGLAPVVLQIEDLHEASAEQARVWQALASRVVRGRAVGLLVTSRAELSEPFEGVLLEPFSPAASVELLRAETGTTLPEEALTWIYQRALGNPLFSLEYFRYLARLGYLWSDGRRWHWRKPQEESLPMVLEALIAHHLQSTGQDSLARQALLAKALLPREANMPMWAEVAELTMPALLEAQQVLNALGILRGSEFAHPLFGEVFARELAPLERQEVARRALTVLAEQPLWAASLVVDAQLPPFEAVQWLRKAAAAAGLDSPIAAHLLGKAVEFASGEEQADLALEAAQALKTHSLPEAVRLVELAYAQQPSSQAGLSLCELYFLQNRVVETETLFAALPQAAQFSELGLVVQMKLRSRNHGSAALLELWREHQSTLVASVTAIQLVVHALRATGNAEGAGNLLNQVLVQQNLSPSERAQLYYAKGNVHAMNAQFQQAIDSYNLALELYGSTDPKAVISMLSNRAMMHNELEQFPAAIASLQESLRLATDLGDGQRRATYLQNMGYIFNSMREFEQAEAVLLEAREELTRFGVEDILIYAESNLSDIYREWDIPYSGPRALRHGRAAVEGARKTNDAFMICNATTVASQAEAKFGDAAVALALADEAQQAALSVQHTLGIATALQARGRALQALNRPQEAIVALREAAEQFTALQMSSNAQSMTKLIQSIEQGPAPTNPKPIQPPATAPMLQILGSLMLGGKAISAEKLQELLALLLEARLQGRSEVGQLELFELLYPDTAEVEAKRALQQLVYRLRQSHGSAIILKTPFGYALGDIKSDAEEFLRTGDTHLWRGLYREGFGFSADETVQGKLYRALFAAIEEGLALEPQEAARAAQILYQADPYSLEALRLLLRALHPVHPAAIASLYTKAKQVLEEVNEHLPNNYLEFMQTG